LHLNGTAITFAGISHCQFLRNLSQLGLGIDHIPINADEAAVLLREFPNLLSLFVGETSDSAVEILAQMPNLLQLSLRGKGVTNRSLDAIAASQSLKHVALYETQISREAHEQFHLKHPGIVVSLKD
jgi:hypothetical protein